KTVADVGKMSDSRGLRFRSVLDMPQGRSSGPGGIHHFSMWGRHCPTEQRTLLRYAESTRSSRPSMRRIVGSSSLSLFLAIHDERSFDAPSHDECSKSEGCKGRTQGRHPFRCRADRSRPSLAVGPLPEVSSRTNGGHLLRAP